MLNLVFLHLLSSALILHICAHTVVTQQLSTKTKPKIFTQLYYILYNSCIKPTILWWTRLVSSYKVYNLRISHDRGLIIYINIQHTHIHSRVRENSLLFPSLYSCLILYFNCPEKSYTKQSSSCKTYFFLIQTEYIRHVHVILIYTKTYKYSHKYTSQVYLSNLK